jgi:hypothetical protein
MQPLIKFDHRNLPVTNYKRSRDWYTENLGFKVEFEVSERQTVSLEDSEGMGIFLYEPKIALAGAKCSMYFQVDLGTRSSKSCNQKASSSSTHQAVTSRITANCGIPTATRYYSGILAPCARKAAEPKRFKSGRYVMVLERTINPFHRVLSAVPASTRHLVCQNKGG